MPLKVFPTCLFSFDGQDIDIERQIVTGGQSLSGDEDVIQTDGGGRVYAAFSEAYLDDRAVALAWRAISGFLEGGVRAIIVPLCDLKHQPTHGFASVPHSDDTPFLDESEYESGDCTAAVGADAALRATTLAIDVTATGKPIIAGEWLSIDHPTWRHRCYRIVSIVSVAGDVTTVEIRPPLREAVTTGEPVELADPKCTMRLDGAMPSPMTGGYAAGSVRFVEDMTGAY